MNKKEFMFDYSLEYIFYMYNKYVEENIKIHEGYSEEQFKDKEEVPTMNFSERF